MMVNANWRPTRPGGGGGGGTEAALDGRCWRFQLLPRSGERSVDKIPIIKGRYRKILLMETERQSTIPNALPFNSAGSSSEDSAVKRAQLPSSNQDETQNMVDYISQLPDAIIFHIFSFLTTKDTIKTSVLSKQWRSTWTFNQYMSFSLPPGGSQKSKGFIAFVDSVLSRYTAKKVKRFLFDAPSPVSMRFSLDRWLPLAVECGVEEVSASLDRWLQFAVEHDVEEVSVTLNNRCHKIYALPQILFSCNTLVSLCISRCRFRVFGTVNWCSLKILRIELAELNDDGMMRVLSGSPVLELLELKRCVGIKHIIIESKSFRELVIDSHEFYGQASMLKISAPHLLKLCLLGKSRGGEFRLDEVSSLNEAELNFEMLDEVKARADLLKGLLERLHNVTKLVMGSWCLQALSLMEARDMFLPSLKCQHLILLGAAGHEGVPEAIAKILESTLLLEKLSLQMTCTPDSEIGLNAEWAGCRVFAGEEFWNFVKWRIYQCLMHLRHVEIVDRGASLLAWEPVLSLLKFLLQNALWLDRIVINSTNSKSSQAFEPSPLLEVARILLSHPKCSPSAKVILRYPFQGCPSV